MVLKAIPSRGKKSRSEYPYSVNWVLTMLLNYCGSKCPHKRQEAEWHTSLHKRHTSSDRILLHWGKKTLIFLQRLLSLYFAQKDCVCVCVWRGAAVRALNVDNLLVTSCCVQTSTGLVECVKLSCECQMVRTEVSGKDARPNKVTWSCCRETKATQTEAKKGWCWLWPGLLHTCKSSSITKHKILCRTISGLNCQRQYDVFALRQSWEAGKWVLVSFDSKHSKWKEIRREHGKRCWKKERRDLGLARRKQLIWLTDTCNKRGFICFSKRIFVALLQI